jgi:hypothetical protein
MYSGSKIVSNKQNKKKKKGTHMVYRKYMIRVGDLQAHDNNRLVRLVDCECLSL